uniref:Uncharacterized protein n=1 Tax=Onchocerca volvulus TaxID=6282 RepID=A0A8R1TSQ9_ONCVO
MSDAVHLRRGRKKGRVAESCGGHRCAIALLTMRRCKDYSLDVCMKAHHIHPLIIQMQDAYRGRDRGGVWSYGRGFCREMSSFALELVE